VTPVLATNAGAHFLLWMGELVSILILLVFFFVYRFKFLKGRSIWSLVGSLLDARAAKIDAQLRLAEESRAEAQRAHEESQAEIAKAREEGAQAVARAGGMTENLRAELAAEAEEERKRIIAQARSVIEAERNRAILELRTNAADVAISAARDIIEQTIDARTDRSIIDQALAESNGSARA
jgi:F-type H+-transporting ATPase subunit b